MQIGSSGEAGKIRKFYKKATVEACADGSGWRVMLDSHELKTTAKHDLHLPSRSLAEALAREWNAQERDVNKQLNDKERVAAALENDNLLRTVNSCLEGVGMEPL